MKNPIAIIKTDPSAIEVKDVPNDAQTVMFATKPLYCTAFDLNDPKIPDPDEWKEERVEFTKQLIFVRLVLANGTLYAIFCDASGDGAKFYATSCWDWIEASV